MPAQSAAPPAATTHTRPTWRTPLGRRHNLLNDTIRAAIMLGKPAETADYATALRETAAAYDALNPPELED